jgi:hypothetical protein
MPKMPKMPKVKNKTISRQLSAISCKGAACYAPTKLMADG